MRLFSDKSPIKASEYRYWIPASSPGKMGSLIKRCFQAFPFWFDVGGRTGTKGYMTPSSREKYIRLLGPNPSPTETPSGNGEQDGERSDPGASTRPKSVEAAYQDILGMLKDHSPDIEYLTRELQKAHARVTQESLRLDMANQEVLSLCAIVSDLNKRVASGDAKLTAAEKQNEEDKKKVLSAQDTVLALDKQVKASNRRVSELEQQLTTRDAELTAAKTEAAQANGRLMNLWARLKKMKGADEKKRKSEPESLVLTAEGGPRTAKRPRNGQQAYVESDAGDN
ncbi:hypothetical protein BU23DRAFT_659719 [Bimuria novae-zelandiae CBS 107.79]|uniref:Uncharacterized protein n=1 Tax=Bimuria novae-zelandiae CBS 107.79 TaxID=1447943 RepID=A0A6A5VL57_9PLEO|nr:hypothetical protein BU23DRAFT_659719 [Bimuria novae-zelandiae CBS 107.79]